MAEKQIRVRATKLGFHGQRRRPGDEFYIDPKIFSKNWMEKVEEEKPKPKRASKPKAEPKAEPGVSQESAEVPDEAADFV